MARKFLRFDKDSPEYGVLIEWWKGLDADRGNRAALRRCNNVTEVAFAPSFHALNRSLMQHGHVDSESLAVVAALAAHVKEHDARMSLAEQMATPKAAGGSSAVSDLRFRRLLRIQDRDELLPALLRVMRLLGGNLNLQGLAESVYGWNDYIRKKWAFDYYSKTPAKK
jgi:CRISPR system Cascade subunit CasB